MERRIDRHEERRQQCRNTLSKINMWREAWDGCYRFVDGWQNVDLKRFHHIFEYWVPFLNRVFDSPIRDLSRYQMTMYYCDEPGGPTEVIHLYMDENPSDDGITSVYVIFNLYEFRKIHANYCTSHTKHNQMMVDEARGTINMAAYQGSNSANPASFFKSMTTLRFLFVFTLHALAHLHIFDQQEHAHYDNHMHIKESNFFKLYFYGQIIRGI